MAVTQGARQARIGDLGGGGKGDGCVPDSRCCCSDIDREGVGLRHCSFAEVDESYSGPKLPSEGVTLEFVQAMMEHFRAQKTLHKK